MCACEPGYVCRACRDADRRDAEVLVGFDEREDEERVRFRLLAEAYGDDRGE